MRRVAIGLSIAMLCIGCDRMPSDQELVHKWQANEHKYGELATLVQREKMLVRVDATGSVEQVPGAKQLNESTRTKIVTLLKDLGVDYILKNKYSSNESLTFGVASFGTFDEGQEKGYLYSEIAVPSLDSLDDVKSNTSTEYRHHIKGNWYVFLRIAR